MKKILAAGVSLLSVQLLSPAALANDVADRITKLEQELQILKRQSEIDKEESAKKAEKTANVDIGKKGLSITSADKDFKISIRGYAQADSRVFLQDNNQSLTDNILLRRVRPIIEGTVYKNYSYRIMPDFAGSTPRLFDGYVDANFLPEAKFRIGKFKTPIGLERLQSGSDLLFVERSLATNLVPNRDLGAQLFGDMAGGTVSYALGIFDGASDLGNADGDTDDNKDVAVRVFAQPFANSNQLGLQNLGFGVAGSYGKRSGTSSNTQLGNYVSPGQATIFSYRSGTTAGSTVFAKGNHTRISPQAYFYSGPAGILGEYVISKQNVTLGTASRQLDNRAWNISTSYVLTGEDASFTGVKPDNNLDFSKGTWGAFELAARYSGLDIDDTAFPVFADSTRSATKATAWSAGANWYLNDNVKINLDYERTVFDGGATGNNDRPAENSVFTRVQYKF
jgi:phosphate-selective porin OprO and OprP